MYSSVRPFGVTAIIGGWDSEAQVEVDAQVGSGPKTGTGGKIQGAKAGGPALYMIEPSGLYWVSITCCSLASRLVSSLSCLSKFVRLKSVFKGYYGAATGKGRQAAKSELEKLDLSSGGLSLEAGVKEAARIIYVAHEDSKDKEFELEMSWISSLDGPTKGRHEEVPRELLEEAEKEAKKSMETDDEDETVARDGGDADTMEE